MNLVRLLCALYIFKVLFHTFISQNQLYRDDYSHFKDEAIEVQGQNQLSDETSSWDVGPFSVALPLLVWLTVGRVAVVLEPRRVICVHAAVELCLCDSKRTLRDTGHLKRTMGASFIHHSAPESPRLCSPELCIPHEVLSAVLLACYDKPQAHICRQLLAGHRSSPRLLVPLSNLFWLCVGSWLSSRRRWKQQPQKGWIWTERSSGLAFLLHCFIILLSEMQTLTQCWCITRVFLFAVFARTRCYEIFSLTLYDSRFSNSAELCVGGNPWWAL